MVLKEALTKRHQARPTNASFVAEHIYRVYAAATTGLSRLLTRRTFPRPCYLLWKSIMLPARPSVLQDRRYLSDQKDGPGGTSPFRSSVLGSPEEQSESSRGFCSIFLETPPWNVIRCRTKPCTCPERPGGRKHLLIAAEANCQHKESSARSESCRP